MILRDPIDMNGPFPRQSRRQDIGRTFSSAIFYALVGCPAVLGVVVI